MAQDHLLVGSIQRRLHFHPLMCCEACTHTNLAKESVLLWQAALFLLKQGSPGTGSSSPLLCTLSWRECFWKTPRHYPMLCCATVSQLPSRAEWNQELGHNHFLSSLHCAVVFKSFCVLGQVEVPAHPSTLKCMLPAREAFPCVLLPAATTKSMGSMRPYDVMARMSRAKGWVGCWQQGKVGQLASLEE